MYIIFDSLLHIITYSLNCTQIETSFFKNKTFFSVQVHGGYMVGTWWVHGRYMVGTQ